MTIEESIKMDSGKFEALLDSKAPEIKSAMNDLSAELDATFNGAIIEYCESEHVEADIDAIPSYKTMNKLITKMLDSIIAEHIKEKRKNL
ncbi:MAG: hypothetical protein IJT79_09520 [Ruminococcus sp.]|nr:hypothetical protein [Ruminococcus sp.]